MRALPRLGADYAAATWGTLKIQVRRLRRRPWLLGAAAAIPLVALLALTYGGSAADESADAEQPSTEPTTTGDTGGTTTTTGESGTTTRPDGRPEPATTGDSGGTTSTTGDAGTATDATDGDEITDDDPLRSPGAPDRSGPGRGDTISPPETSSPTTRPDEGGGNDGGSTTTTTAPTGNPPDDDRGLVGGLVGSLLDAVAGLL